MPHPHVPYAPPRLSHGEARLRLEAELALLTARRSVRRFSRDPVPRLLIEQALRIAGTAPSGAHRQPWHFVAIADPEKKRAIREAAEREERDFYERRAPPEWLAALEPLGTDFEKTHLTDAPWLIVVFQKNQEVQGDGSEVKTYYAAESVGIALGFLIASLHRAGLATLPHTPAPMTFLREVCGRPASDRPYVILPVGYPSVDCTVPDLQRKTLPEIATFVE
jgi:iodotyrosine deiodinase